MSASCTSAQGRPLCPRCPPVAPLPPSSAHLPALTAANALRVRGFGGSGGARPCRGIVRHPGGEVKTAHAPPAAADGLDLSALLPFAADKGARAVKFSARGSRLALSDARPLIRHTRGRRRGVKAKAAAGGAKPPLRRAAVPRILPRRGANHGRA